MSSPLRAATVPNVAPGGDDEVQQPHTSGRATAPRHAQNTTDPGHAGFAGSTHT